MKLEVVRFGRKSTGIERFRKNKTNHPAEVVGLNGAEHIESIVLKKSRKNISYRLFYSSWSP
jgi:hypothetical protein